MAIKFNLDTDFNNDGANGSPQYKAVVFGQRKWIIIFGTVTYLLAHGAISLNQRWLAFEFSINSESTGVLRTLAGAPFFFLIYAIFRSYPYLQKNTSILRSEFQKTELTNSDTFSERLVAMEKRRDELERLVAEAREKIDKASLELDDAAAQVAEISRRFPGALNDPFKSNPRNALASIGQSTDEDRARSSLVSYSQLYNQRKIDVVSLNNSLTAHLDESSALSEHISALSLNRSKVIATNQRRWQVYCFTSWAAEVASMAPAGFSLFYCAKYLLRS